MSPKKKIIPIIELVASAVSRGPTSGATRLKKWWLSGGFTRSRGRALHASAGDVHHMGVHHRARTGV